MARILVVDDDKRIRSMLEMMLVRAGHQVDTASDGQQALEHLAGTPVDLIILDIVMPEKDGLETIMEIRKKAPEMKVIAISGGGVIEPNTYLEVAAGLGAQQVFTKPLDRGELLAAVNILVGGARAQR